MKKLLISLVTVGAVAGIGFYATNAFFSDTETSNDNTFAAGKLDLKVDYRGFYNGDPIPGWTLTDLTSQKFFDLADVKPGDGGQGNISLHVDNNDAWGCVTINPTANDDMGCTEPESLVDTTCDNPGPGQGELAQDMEFHIFADVCNTPSYNVPGDNVYTPGCDIELYQGPGITSPITIPLADSTHNNVFTGAAGPLKGTDTYYIGSYWNIANSIGNEIQTDKYTADISFYTEQFRNNPGFVCTQRLH